MKLYKIVLNNPQKDGTKEITINKEMLDQLIPALNEKRLVGLGDGFINTAYIVIIEPDEEAMKLEEQRLKSIEAVKQLKLEQ